VVYYLTMPKYLRFDSESEWLAWREATPYSVGGGKLVEILGIGFKTAIRPGQAKSGHEAEALIMERAANILMCEPPERGLCVEDEEEPWMRGSLDAVIPETEVWEIKLVGRGWASKWADGCDPKVRVQGIWYSQITGLPLRVIAVFLDDYAVPKGANLETLIASSALRMWTFSLRETLEDRMALVETARAWRESMLTGDAQEPTPKILLPSGPERRRVRQATPEECVLLARYDAALQASRDLELLKDQIRTCARGSAGLRGGGRLALVNGRGAVTLKDQE
jgi:hypothetical protein